MPEFDPVHTLVTAGEIVPPEGPDTTVTVTLAVEVQPFAPVPVTVYVVVVAGDADTVAPVVDASPVEGLHVYETAPLAVNAVLSPWQIGSGVFTVTAGLGFTVRLMLQLD